MLTNTVDVLRVNYSYFKYRIFELVYIIYKIVTNNSINNRSQLNEFTHERESELSKILLEAYEVKKLVEKFLISKLEEYYLLKRHEITSDEIVKFCQLKERQENSLKRQKNRNQTASAIQPNLAQLQGIHIPENLFSLTQSLLQQNNQQENLRSISPMTIADIMDDVFIL